MNDKSFNNKNNELLTKENIEDKKIKEIKFIYNISDNPFNFYEADNSFVIFKSIYNKYYIIFASKNNIISYNLNNQQIENEIKNAHQYFITSFRHCLYRNKDIIMSVSPFEKNIKIWDTSIWDNIINITNIYSEGLILSACFLKYNNQYFILSSNIDLNFDKIPEPIKIFNFEGKKIKELKNSNEYTFLIDTHYDDKNKKYYIIVSNINSIKSYDYEKNEIYHKYKNNSINEYFNFIIYNNENITKIIKSYYSCKCIEIWDFHKGILLDNIYINFKGIIGICLYNKNYLFAGSYEGLIKIIDLKKKKIINNLEEHQSRICSIKTFIHPIYGDCLISQGWLSEPIKLWIIKN